jgi:transcriptional regulator with XRE-family HTH domain
MKLLVSREWLRTRIMADADVDTEAGTALAVLEGLGVTVPVAAETNQAALAPDKRRELRIALGSLIRQLRFHNGLSVSSLAGEAQIPEDEIRLIEHDPHHSPKPRTLYRLANRFNLPVRQLTVMSGATRTVDRHFYNEAVQFAAHADDLVVLDDNETKVLYAFVKYMNEREGLKRD